jgi:hypothetical protein
MVVLELGRNHFGIDDPVSSALRSLERVPDEKLGPNWASAQSRAVPPSSHPVAGSTARIATLADGRSGHSSVSEAKGVLSLSTSSSSSAPSAPIEVVPFRESEPPRRLESRKSSWSALDALVVGVAVLTIVLSALALAWFLAS